MAVNLDTEVFNLSRFDLLLENVVFQQNTVCMTINPKKSNNELFRFLCVF